MPWLQVLIHYMRPALLAALLCGPGAHAQIPATPVAPASPPAAIHAADESTVMLANRPIATLRSPLLGMSPSERARRTERVITELLRRGGPAQVTLRHDPQGEVLMIDGSMALILTAADADQLRGETLDTAAKNAASALGHAIAETQEARDKGRMLRGAGWSLGATSLFLLLLWALMRLRAWLIARLAGVLKAKASEVKIAGAPVLHASRAALLARWLVRALFLLIAALLIYEWLSFVLTQFPYTRAWGEQLESYLIGVVAILGGGVLNALPDLLVAVVIFMLARIATRTTAPLFDRIEAGYAHVGWLDQDMARPTRRLVSAGIWLFAIVMAYPYLPGSNSDAFKGVSVLVGLMITLGGSSLIGQAASGLILLYSRTLRTGEFVRIGDVEGTVHELGTFTTKIRTGLGEEISLPNSLILSSVTRNYSRTVKGRGFIIDTAVTIGYDTPWRQVEAMLIEAAQRTPGILADPPPRVRQTALSDFYAEYRLVAQAVPSEPRPRAEVLNALHGHIQDVFNEYGVQIMSPHYVSDPAVAKTVAPADWYPSPARRPDPR